MILLPILVLVFVLMALWLFLRRKKQNLSAATSVRAMPGTYDPHIGSDRGFDVFLNFRGPDSRHTVANVLYNSLTRAGFRVFLDNEEIRKGEVIEGELLRAITNSNIYIPIFSKDYASSKWCLRELAKMIDCWETSGTDTKKVILPIFYDVDVSEDVKLRSRVYTTALQKHNDELGEVAVRPWKDALQKVAKIKGWNLKDHGLSELVDLINEEVSRKLTKSEAVPSLTNHLVGIDKPVEDILELLEEGSPSIQFIVIHGMGGIGKTTLADIVFKKISSRFQGSCFLRDVRRSTSANDVVKLQEKLLLDTLQLNFIKISDIDDGIDTISKRLRDKNVLIVLDDVDKREHLLNLAANSFWFGPKSKIIITTRGFEFIPTKSDGEYNFYEMREMDYHHSLQLFCWHAFEKDWPSPEFYDVSTEIVATTGGLPLSLQVIGSSLYNQGKGTWKFRLEKLKEAPHKDVQETLMISYQALEYEQQQIFLDIACLFDGDEKTYPFYFWEACKLYPKSGIEILEKRSLIKVFDRKILWMHDQLRDFGRAAAQLKKPCTEGHFPRKSSRLWSPNCALDALQKQEVDESTIALNLGALDADRHFLREQFLPAVNLKFLQLYRGNFDGDFTNVFQQLIFLSWFDCPLRFEATNLCFKNLVILKLSMSQIDEDWGGWGVFMESRNLKVLHLEGCKRLKKTPNLSALMRLERLILRDCLELEEIDISMNKLKHLKCLEISNSNGVLWKPLLTVPPRPQLIEGSIGDLQSLKELKIYNGGLTKLHPSIGELVHLRRLWLICPFLESLPSFIGELTLLVELDLSHSGIKELPESIGDLKRLQFLRMAHSALENLPDTIGRLESLELLDLLYTKITQLPETIGDLERLKVIIVSYTNLKMLPKALAKLENLEFLDASYCPRMDDNLPEEIGKLSRLRNLRLAFTAISRVPMTIKQLSHLQELDLYKIHEPQELVNLPTSLTTLRVISSSLESHRVPDLSNMTNLVELVLSNHIDDDSHWTLSPRVQTPQMQWLARLPKLQVLTLFLADLVSPPTELSSLPCLHSLGITYFGPQSFSHLPSSLGDLRLVKIKSPIHWQHLSSLNNLSGLKLSGCWLKEIKVDCLERLHHLSISDCVSLERLSNLSCLKMLLELSLLNFPHLVDIEGLEELKSLRVLRFIRCSSIQCLPNLWGLKNLEFMLFEDCNSLESIPNVGKDEKLPCHLKLLNCKHFRDFDGPYSECHRAMLCEGSSKSLEGAAWLGDSVPSDI